ncbi:MAG: ABC transporter substrate-binding protein [Geobacteraceae bacterium GWC2_55_20]|nr:MAG: ABC transporter substrate-binding protein [Geobacteraceae bacterium GWC2_55_20]HCE68287.1 ABC transporter substrate-binding protein [Geobacter sp.]
MRRIMLLILALATLLPSLAQAYDVLVLQSRRDPYYDEVVKGFRTERNTSVRLLVLSDYSEVDVVRIVREDKPRMILAVGDSALKAARKVQSTPVLAVMTLGIPDFKSNQSNLSGISMFVSPERYIGVFRNMKTRRVGVVHNPAKSGWYMNQARQIARQSDIELVVREISTSRETLDKLSGLAGKVDALWMLPDTIAVTRETTEAYFRFGQQYSVPVISFSGTYIGLGAAVALEIDRYALGRQADGLAVAILSGQRSERQVIFPAKTELKKNNSVLQRLRVEPGRN